MAEEKKESKDDKNWVITYLPVVVIVLLLLIGARIDDTTIFKPVPVEESNVSQDKNFFDIYNWIGNDELSLGSTVINTDTVPVRTVPAGSILGTQKKLKTGRLIEGPVNQFNMMWWRIDYENAPDGWVEYTNITTKIKTVQTINIIPIVYGFYKPIGYSFVFILFLVFIFFKLKLRKEEKIYQRKQELKQEQFKSGTPTLQQKLDEKSVVEGLPGFQTEEIIPTKIEQKNNRWKHIQELIKSYNASDWRQAIIEADIMLEEMVDKMGYQGNTIGEKLKSVEKSDFITLDKAWSAHRIRNQIAHDGSAFKLTREVAERTIKEYEMVFKEFYYI